MAKNVTKYASTKTAPNDLKEAILSIINECTKQKADGILSCTTMNASFICGALNAMGYNVNLTQIRDLLQNMGYREPNTNESSVTATTGKATTKLKS